MCARKRKPPELDRRKFFSMLGLTAGAGVSLSVIRAIAPEAQAVEIRRDRQYVFRLPQRVSMQELQRLSEALRGQGVNAIVIDSEVEIFEVNGP